MFRAADPGRMQRPARPHRCVVVLLALVSAASVGAAIPDPVDHSIRQFLARDDVQHPYEAVRRLEARNGDRTGWMEATTAFSTHAGFRYQITAEGGSDSIRAKVLRAVLEGERQVIALGETARSAIEPANYIFRANGVDSHGLANVTLAPRRKERVLLSGTMFLRPGEGELVRLEGRLAKSPSFWIKNVDIVRTYERINGAVVPVRLDSRAQVRFLGAATLQMTYRYSEIDGRPVVGR
jgi:hypothetical protein